MLAATAAFAAALGWTALFNGHDLTGWETWLGIPDKSVTGLDLPRDQEGRYTAPLGLNVDPRHVFTVVEVDGKPAIRISGEGFGALTGKQEYDDFHLRLEFKWGEKKWPPRENVVRDSGILYYAVGEHGASPNKAWMRSLECQVQEHDVGDYWGVAGAIVDVAGERRSLGDGQAPLVHFVKGSPALAIEGPTPRAIKALDNENPTGSWNTVEVLCLRGTCVHAVNGKVNLVLTSPRQPAADGGTAPLTKGRLQIQTEGAEVFYRNIEVRPITEFPKAYRAY
jgi:3-keto-disaccharide hydrolase